MKDRSSRILIIGDDPILRDLLREIVAGDRPDDEVEAIGLDVFPSVLADYDSPDVMIVDGGMSGAQGLELIARAQAVHPGAHAVLITAADPDEVAERGRRTAASFASFTVPFSIDLFLQHVQRVLTDKTTGLYSPAVAASVERDHKARAGLDPAWGWR